MMTLPATSTAVSQCPRKCSMFKLCPSPCDALCRNGCRRTGYTDNASRHGGTEGGHTGGRGEPENDYDAGFGDDGRKRLPEAKLLEVRRRGSATSGFYSVTRRNVFDGEGEVWLGVGTLTSNAVWVAPSKDHVVVSISEGGALMFGKNINDCMGPVTDVVKEDPDIFNTPAVSHQPQCHCCTWEKLVSVVQVYRELSRLC